MADMTKNDTKTLRPNLGLEAEQKEGIVNVLKTVLADEYTLYTRLRNYHWNVTGAQFDALHDKFEEQYTQIEEVIDDLAERIRTYGAFAPGTMKEFLELTRLTEKPGDYPYAREMVLDLVADHELMVRSLRRDIELCGENYNDVASEDFLTGLLQTHQEMAWMLRSFIEGRAVHE